MKSRFFSIDPKPEVSDQMPSASRVCSTVRWQQKLDYSVFLAVFVTGISLPTVILPIILHFDFSILKLTHELREKKYIISSTVLFFKLSRHKWRILCLIMVHSWLPVNSWEYRMIYS
jgi:hypothetical protein